MQTPLLRTLATSLEVEKLRLTNFPGFIFLCGGQLPQASRPPQSVRAYFHAHVRQTNPRIFNKLILAETIKEWYLDGTYGDLLQLEEDLAHLASLTILFLESPGSIAEFGAFTLLPPIQSKLCAVIEHGHYNSESFIKLGPIRHLENLRRDAVHVYPWRRTPTNDLVDEGKALELVAELSEDIELSLQSVPKEFLLDREDSGHIMLLLVDLLDLLVIATESDLLDVLQLANLKPLRKRLRQLLFVLRKLRLVTLYTYGRSTQKYYISVAKVPFVRYAFNSSAPTTNRERWRHLFRNAYDAEDPRRLRALRAYLREQPSSIAAPARD